MNNDYIHEQIPFGTDSFADNPEPRCPCLLLLDTSGSMQGEPIQELNAGLRSFKEDLISDPLAVKRVEVAIITFGPVAIRQEFQSAQYFQPPTFSASGDTPLGDAITRGLELVQNRKSEIRANLGHGGLYRPWIFLFTDGVPTDEWQLAAKSVRDGETAKAFSFFGISLGNGDMTILKQICPETRPP